MTLVEALEKNAAEFAEKPAIVFHDKKTNYGEFNRLVNRFAGALLELGLKKGDRVVLMLPRIPELVIGFLGIAKARGIAVPVNYELTDKNVNAILNNVSPLCVITHVSFLELIKKSIPQNSDIRIITVGGSEPGLLSWEDALNLGKPENPCLPINDEDIIYLNYTSGSTGTSKGAVTTYSNIYWNTAASIDSLELTADDIHLCMFAPFAHPHEIFARPVYLGGTMVLVDKVYPKSIAEAIANHRVTCMMGLVPMYENLLDVLEHKEYDLSSLRVPESGGMYTPVKLIERFMQRVGIPIIPVWGSTETTGIAIAVKPGKLAPAGSVGKPCKSYEVKIVDDRGRELPTGRTGEMIFRGPAVVSGYYGDDITTSSCFRNGWYYSSDLGKCDGDGNFYFIERKMGMMKIAGLKVYPLEIERALLEHPDIREVVVVALDDRLRGKVPKAIIVPVQGKNIKEDEILSFCKDRLPRYKLPREIELRESLPKTGSGKVNRKAL